MKRLSPTKRNQLIMVVVATIGLICTIYFMLIQPQYEKNKEVARDTVAAQVELQKIKQLIGQRETTSALLEKTVQQLNHAEQDIAVGDVYSWTYDTIRQFKAKYPLDIPSVGQPVISPVDLIGNIPYKQARVTLIGTGYYHDIGKFVADFENNFPHIRLINLSLDPIAGAPGTAIEKLNFKMDLVTLVKP